MTVLLQNQTRVSVALTGEDMARLGITYDSLDPTAAGTRRAIIAVFDEACRQTGARPQIDGGFLVETLPGCRSGCILIFSARDGIENGCICRVQTADAFLDCLSILKSRDLFYEAYFWRGNYYVCFRGAANEAFFSEYGSVSTDPLGLRRARLAEYGKRLNIG
ncbi:MAG: hypothetical protein IK118_04970 [Clostridia bacterium]|nr:hypothetical protein [Clostridia bacterium]